MKTITALGLAALAVLSPAKAMARGQSNFQDHVRLAQAAKATGVRVAINVDRCDDKKVYGWYWAAKNELIICQENKIQGSSKEVDWTEEDLDTLRHEVQHLIQDCRDGRRDGNLDAIYNKPIELAHKVLGEDGVIGVISAYANASDHIKVMELEAFAVAAMNDPMEQVSDIATYCF